MHNKIIQSAVLVRIVKETYTITERKIIELDVVEYIEVVAIYTRGA